MVNTLATFRFKYDKKISINKTIRFPLPLVEKIEKILEGTESTFSRFVIQACEYALEHMDQDNEKTHS